MAGDKCVSVSRSTLHVNFLSRLLPKKKINFPSAVGRCGKKDLADDTSSDCLRLHKWALGSDRRASYCLSLSVRSKIELQTRAVQQTLAMASMFAGLWFLSMRRLDRDKKHEQCSVRPSLSHLLLVNTPRSSKQRPGKEFLITQASAVTRTLQGSESTRPYSYKLIKCRNPLGRAQLLYS